MPDINQYGCYEADLTGVAATSGGGLLALANPEGRDLIIDKVVMDITTPSSGAANVNAGVAANGTTSSATLMDTVAVGSAILADNITNKGAGGAPTRKWASGQFVTLTGSATTVGLIGRLYISYHAAKP